MVGNEVQCYNNLWKTTKVVMQTMNRVDVVLKKDELQQAVEDHNSTKQVILSERLRGHEVFVNLQQDEDALYFKVDLDRGYKEEYEDQTFYILNDDFAAFYDDDNEIYELVYQE